MIKYKINPRERIPFEIMGQIRCLEIPLSDEFVNSISEDQIERVYSNGHWSVNSDMDPELKKIAAQKIKDQGYALLGSILDGETNTIHWKDTKYDEQITVILKGEQNGKV